MNKQQLDHWLQASQKEECEAPKVFVVSCADLSHYSLAVEYKHKLEPILVKDQLAYYSSLESVKEELKKLGLSSAYLRLHNAYDEFGHEGNMIFQDIELHLVS
ncbi:DUF6482 family protein [Vibrio rumoiensis]|uniref:Uncharacterized protein n=1 Tax=Vibrio rumoiensis 1S-45 TaxID=1188252 RepID=A0A1E5DYG5_9VIBR|nr:DUF6482 family protein [Vibrio rumoiensis]OEF22591.1 hypothetical protein A1QC_13725 [Vibrio rumoiensis 1S-45]